MSEEQTEPQAQPNPQPTPPPFNQSQFPPPHGAPGLDGQYGLPNATAVLVLGIVSIVFCCCYGIIGLIPAIIALVLAKKDRRLYATNPAIYKLSSYNNLNAGRVCAIIGLILNIIALLYFVFILIMFGAGMLSDPKKIEEMIRAMQ